MTPLGHVAVGYLVGRAAAAKQRAYAVVTALAAATPDVDFVMIGSPHFNALHRVVTHNVAFVLAVALVGFWPIARRWSLAPRWVFAALVAGGLTHVLVDACLDTNASNGIGVALWWPWSDAMFSPVNLVTPVATKAGWGDPAAALAASAVELVWELPCIVLAIVWWRLGARSAVHDRK